MPAVGTSIGMDGAELVAHAQSDEIKQRLRKETDSAINQFVFGVPTIIVDDELFWGFDDFTHLELFLAGKDPLDRTVLDEWLQIRPSASRRERE